MLGVMRAGLALLAIAAVACSPGATTSPPPIASRATEAASPSQSAQPSVTPTPTPTVYATPSPITDIAQVFRPRTNSWRPTGPTIMAVTTQAFTSTLVAIPFDRSGPTARAVPLVDFFGGWDVTPSGGMLAVGVATPDGVRFATLDLTSMKSVWAGAPDPTVQLTQPVWSKDGRYLYYATFGPAPEFRGAIKRIALDGSGTTSLAELDRLGQLEGVTPDGGQLIWERIQEGGSTELFDLSTRTSRHLDDVARVASMRATQPRIILGVGGCCAGYPGGSLVLWDDAAMTSRVLADRTPSGATAWGAASWDPTGARIVAVRYDTAHRYLGMLVFIDLATGAEQPLPGDLVASGVTWLGEGIVYSVTSDPPGPDPNVELRIVPASGGSPVSIYKGANLYRYVFIRP